MRRAIWIVISVPLFWGIRHPAFAQGSSAGLTGLVTDTSEAVVQGASVKAKNPSTNVVRSTTTDATGYYRFPSLPVVNTM